MHRDVSPSNLMASYEGNVKVVDFGVAKAADRQQETRSGTVKGKIAYLSPEQCVGAPVDRRSDLFALGIVMWEMLAMDRLYKRGSDFESMQAIVSEAPPRPSSRRAGIPSSIDAIVLKLLSKDARHRFATADAVVEAIEQAAAASSTVISPSVLSRYLRDLFGQRPEPWLELEQEAAEPVTVTSEPLPRDLVVPQPTTIDRQLAQVRTLATAQREAETSASDAVEVPTERATHDRDEAPTVRAMPAVDEAPTAPAPSPAVTLPMPTVAPARAFEALVEEEPPPPSRIRWPLFIGGTLAAVGLAIALAIGLGGNHATNVVTPAAPDAEVPVDAAASVAIPIDIDAALPDAEIPDAEIPDAEPPDAEIPDAAEAMTAPPDAAPKGPKRPPKHPSNPKKNCDDDPMSCQH